MKRMAGMLVVLTAMAGCGLLHKDHADSAGSASIKVSPSANKDLSSKELVISPGDAKKASSAGETKPAGGPHMLPEPTPPAKPADTLPDTLPGAAQSRALPSLIGPPPTTATLAGASGTAFLPSPVPVVAPSPPVVAVAQPLPPPLPPLPLPAPPVPASQPLSPVDYKTNAPEASPTLQQPLVLDQGKSTATPPAVRIVSSKHIVLDFALRDGPAVPMAGVELWYTRDGQAWYKHPSPLQRRSPVVVDVADEGTYGFTLVACSEACPITKRPQAGDLPQAWVAVDVTRPTVKLTSVEPRGDLRERKLAILWRASDANLGARPITLLYAENSAGPWTPIAANLPNTGCYQWQVPASLPPRLLIRVEATDEVGNVGFAQTPDPVLVDLTQPCRPHLAILTIEPMEEK